MTTLGIILILGAIASWRTNPGHSQTLLVVSKGAAVVLWVLGNLLLVLGA